MLRSNFIFPDPTQFNQPIIPTSALQSFGDVIAGNFPGVTNTAWPTASRAIFTPFEIYVPQSFTGIAIYNGATASGNMDVGVYDLLGNRLASSGSTAQTGITVFQIIPFTATVTLSPAVYMMAIAIDNITATIRATAPPIQWCEVKGLRQMASAFPLPSTATYAIPATALVPYISLMTGTVL